jgi:hypothetical protein
MMEDGLGRSIRNHKASISQCATKVIRTKLFTYIIKLHAMETRGGTEV